MKARIEFVDENGKCFRRWEGEPVKMDTQNPKFFKVWLLNYKEVQINKEEENGKPE